MPAVMPCPVSNNRPPRPPVIECAAASPEEPVGPVVWCPVCGNAPATVEHKGFCSRECRAASLDYHNTQAVAADDEYERRGSYVHDKTHDRKGTRS